jgi:large subunit ribosomal protein L25
MTTLTIEKRDASENLKALRASGFVPGVFYGPKEASTPIKFNKIEFIKVYREAGESTIITLKGNGEDRETLVKDFTVDPVRGEVQHVDFYVVEKGKKVEVTVPLVFVGTAPAEADLDGVLVKVAHEIEVEAMPKDLPHEIEVSIDSLVDFEAQIHARDIVMPAGVTLLSDPDEVIVLVQEQREEELDTPVEAPDLSTIEVAGAKKADEEVEA